MSVSERRNDSIVKKLTAAQVKAIKRAFKAGVPMTRLARRFGVAT